jgi:predicted TIM-barrel fold metal-dependent hydrolase
MSENAEPSVPVLPHPSPNAAWLAQRTEPAIEPEMPIIDPHHHLWDRHGGYYLDELLADTGSGHTIVSTVFLQCNYGYRLTGPEALRPVGETEFVAAVAREADRRGGPTRVCEGIVAYADLTLGDAVAPVLEAQREAAEGRLRGIRYLTARDESFRGGIAPPPPARLMMEPGFRHGFAHLQRFGLSFDAWLYHTQIDELTDLANAFPNTIVVLNHTGGPLGVGPYAGRRDAVFADWHAAINRLAECPNATAKLGGLAMVVIGHAFHERPLPPTSEELVAAWRPYFDACIEAFGPDRCMFESNFPVDKHMCSYRVLWNTFKRAAAGYTAAEKAALFHNTAARVYRLQS